MDFYVYAHINPTTMKPFYIGKGKCGRITETKHRSELWNNVVNKYGYVATKLVDGLTNEQACEIEKQYIKKYGFFKAGGTLVNLTIGGEGGNTFDPIGGRSWNTGLVMPEAQRAKIRASRVGKKHTPATKVKVLSALEKARDISLHSRISSVRCLITNNIWNSRTECMNELSIGVSCFKQRVKRNCPIKGYHLKLIK